MKQMHKDAQDRQEEHTWGVKQEPQMKEKVRPTNLRTLCAQVLDEEKRGRGLFPSLEQRCLTAYAGPFTHPVLPGTGHLVGTGYHSRGRELPF